MAEPMPDLLSAALFERDDRVLTAHRRADRPPFAGQWLLPMTAVRRDETAEDAVARHAREQFGVGVSASEFIDTVYIDDPDDAHRFVANIFRARMAEGPMRFRTNGDYDDARWLAAVELEGVWMPPALREPVVRFLRDPAAPADTDWSSPHVDAATQATPLGESAAQGGTHVPFQAPPPDNRVAWNTIAKAWQEERYGERFGGQLMWSWRASENDLHVLDDVRGKQAIVLGCGGGQDVVALVKLGATAVGIDFAAQQLVYARSHATKHDADNASFVEGDLTDLTRFDDASFDFAVSIHALDYVEQLELALTEAARVLRQDGVLAIAVKHPFDVHLEGGPPYTMCDSYWTQYRDEEIAFASGVAAPVRVYLRTLTRWFDAIGSAGFNLERVVEPDESRMPRADDDALSDDWLAMLPYTIVFKARKR